MFYTYFHYGCTYEYQNDLVCIEQLDIQNCDIGMIWDATHIWHQRQFIGRKFYTGDKSLSA